MKHLISLLSITILLPIISIEAKEILPMWETFEFGPDELSASKNTSISVTRKYRRCGFAIFDDKDSILVQTHKVFSDFVFLNDRDSLFIVAEIPIGNFNYAYVCLDQELKLRSILPKQTIGLPDELRNGIFIYSTRTGRMGAVNLDGHILASPIYTQISFICNDMISALAPCSSESESNNYQIHFIRPDRPDCTSSLVVSIPENLYMDQTSAEWGLHLYEIDEREDNDCHSIDSLSRRFLSGLQHAARKELNEALQCFRSLIDVRDCDIASAAKSNMQSIKQFLKNPKTIYQLGTEDMSNRNEYIESSSIDEKSRGHIPSILGREYRSRLLAEIACFDEKGNKIAISDPVIILETFSKSRHYGRWYATAGINLGNLNTLFFCLDDNLNLKFLFPPETRLSPFSIGDGVFLFPTYDFMSNIKLGAVDLNGNRLFDPVYPQILMANDKVLCGISSANPKAQAEPQPFIIANFLDIYSQSCLESVRLATPIKIQNPFHIGEMIPDYDLLPEKALHNGASPETIDFLIALRHAIHLETESAIDIFRRLSTCNDIELAEAAEFNVRHLERFANELLQE